MSQERHTTLSSSTPAASQIPHKVRLYAASPLAGFNQLFPLGVPVAHPEPNLSIGDRECYEAILPRDLNTSDLLIALFQPHTPDALCRVWLEWGIVALPIDWVEVAA